MHLYWKICTWAEDDVVAILTSAADAVCEAGLAVCDAAGASRTDIVEA